MTLRAHKTFHEEIQQNNDDRLQNRLAFVEVDAETKEALQEYRPYLKKVLPHVLVEFYEHIRKWDRFAPLFNDEFLMDQTRKTQENHWLTLFGAKFDEDYKDSVHKIGLVHNHLGLEPTWYISCYTFILNRLYTHATHQYKSFFSPKEAQTKTAQLIRALNQCIMIDMDIVISLYLEENKRPYEDKFNELADRFRTTLGTLVTGVSSTTEEISSSMAHISDMAQKSHQSAEYVATETDVSVTTLHDLKSTIDKVNDVTNLISDITSRTNLLVLNAAIDAARAGESGKGFAVIASEVKSLVRATESLKTQVMDMIIKTDDMNVSLESVKKTLDDNKIVLHETATQDILENTKDISKQSAALRSAVSTFIEDIKKGF